MPKVGPKMMFKTDGIFLIYRDAIDQENYSRPNLSDEMFLIIRDPISPLGFF
jgi:hypothetical protein